MKKILKSGVEVEDSKYYKLLEWKESNKAKFEFFCQSYFLKHRSINELTEQEYNALLLFSNLD